MSEFDQDSSVIFSGSCTKTGTSTKAYYLTSLSRATHIKIAGKNEFLEIGKISQFFVRGHKDQVVSLNDIINGEADEDGDTGSNNSNVEYSCVIDDQEYDIEPKAYALMTTMVGVSKEEVEEIDNKKKKGEATPDLFYRCEDNTYVNREDIAPPAYKYAEIGIESLFDKRTAGIEVLLAVLKDNTKIEVTRDQIFRRDGKDFVRYNGNEFEVKKLEDFNITKSYLQSKEVTEEGAEIIVDRIVDMSRISHDGPTIVAELGNGKKIEIGEMSIELAEPIIEHIAPTVKGMGVKQETLLEFAPTQGEKGTYARSIKNNQSRFNMVGDGEIIYEFDENFPAPEGEEYNGRKLKKIKVSSGKDRITYIYEGGHEKVIIKEKSKLAFQRTKEGRKENLEIIGVEDLFVEDLGQGRIRVVKLEQQDNVEATDIEFTDGVPTSFKLNDTQVKNIQYENGVIRSYEIGEVTIYNIEWNNKNTIKSCKIKGRVNQHEIKLPDADITPAKYPIFSRFFIKNIDYVAGSEIEHTSVTDIECDNETGSISSFKIGNRKFSNISWDSFKKLEIDTCTVTTYDNKGNIVDEQIGVKLQSSELFKNLKFNVSTILRENISRFEMLRHSNLLKKNNEGAYEVDADVVQTTALQDGVAKASQIQDAEQAREARDEFLKDPFETFVVEEDGTTHTLSNFEDLFKEDGEFNQEVSNTITDILGKNPIIYSKGDIEIKRSMAEEDAVAIPFQIGGALCSTGILIPLGLPIMALAGVNNLIGKAIRFARKERIKNYDIHKMTRKLQDDAMGKCETNINKLSQDFVARMTRARQNLTEAEFSAFQASEEKKFRQLYMKEVGNLQVLSNGGLNSPFDMSKKGKITHENYMVYLACRDKQDEILHGKKDSPELTVVLGSIDKSYKGELRSLTAQREEIEKKIAINQGNDSLLRQRHELDQQIETLKAQNMQDRLTMFKQYGGAKGMTEAYAIESSLEYIKSTSEYKEATTPEQQEAIIKAKQDTAKQTYQAYMAENGSLEDRIKYGVKNSPEYKVASRKERREMITKYREAEHARVGKVSMQTVEFEQRMSGKEPLISSVGRGAMAHLESVLTATREGTITKAPEFNIGKAATENLQGESFVSGMAPVVKSKASTVGKDAEVAASYVASVKKEYSKTGDKLAEAGSIVESAKASGDYVEAFKGSLAVRAIGRDLDNARATAETQLKSAKDENGQSVHIELYSSTQQEIKSSIEQSAQQYGKDNEAVEAVMSSLKAGYDKSVKRKSAEEFKEEYKDQICAFALQDNLSRTSLQGSLTTVRSQAEKKFVAKYIRDNASDYERFSDRFTRRAEMGVSEIKQKFVASNKKKFAAFKSKFKGKQEMLVEAYIAEYQGEYESFYDRFTGRSSATETEKREAYVRYLTDERKEEFEASRTEYVRKKVDEYLHSEQAESEILKKYLTEFIKSNEALEEEYKKMLVKNDCRKIIEAKLLVSKHKEAFKTFAKSNKFSVDSEEGKLRAISAYYLFVKDRQPSILEELRSKSDYYQEMYEIASKHYNLDREEEVEFDDGEELSA